MLLDTNVVSELRKVGDGRADPRVVAFFSEIDQEDLYLSAITLMELELGVTRIERRDFLQGELLRTWMSRHVIPSFHDRILPVKFIQWAHGGALLFGPLTFRWTTVVQPSFSRVECVSRGPGCSGAGRRGPRDRRVTAEHVT